MMIYMMFWQLWATEIQTEEQTAGKSGAHFFNAAVSSVPLASVNSSHRKENASHQNLLVEPTDNETNKVSSSVQEKDVPVPARLPDGDNSLSIHTLRTEEILSSRRFHKDIQENDNEIELSSVLNQGEEETPFDLFLNTFFEGALNSETRASLEKLWAIETSWRNTIRWASVDSILQRLVYLLSINRDGITSNDSQKKQHCLQPVWLSGGSFPLASEHNRKIVQFIDGLRQGTEFAIFRSIQIGLIALTLYHLYVSPNLGSILQFYRTNDAATLMQDLFRTKDHLLRFILCIPAVWGLVKGGWNLRNSTLSEEKIEKRLQEINCIKSGIYNDIFRWLLPLHPMNRQTSSLMKNVLWNPEISADNLQKIFTVLQNLALEDRGYTSIHALGYLMNLVHGMNMQDILRLVKVRAQEEKDERTAMLADVFSINDDMTANLIHSHLQLKAKALSVLQEAALLHKGRKIKTSTEFVAALYAKYLLWYLGVPQSHSDNTFFTSLKGRSLSGFLNLLLTFFKIGKLSLQAVIVKTGIDTLFSDPPPIVCIPGVKPYANATSQECFYELVRTFNTLPGQPVDTLVGNLMQYYFPDCTVSLDFSKKTLQSETILYDVISALYDKNIMVKSLNLSNMITVIPKQIKNFFPFVRNIEVLDLSASEIFGMSECLDQNLQYLSNLRTLNISNAYDPNGKTYFLNSTINNLQYLAELRSLGLAGCQIESDLTVEQILQSSTKLIFLDLSGCIGSDSNSIKGLQSLTALQFLDLSGNGFGYLDDNGTVAFGQSLRYLANLTSLNLYDNYIGSTSSKGVAAIGENLRYLTALKSLNFVDNQIGKTDSNGTVTLFKTLHYLTALTSLDLSANLIGYTDSAGMNDFIAALSQLNQLEYINLRDNRFPFSTIQDINKALTHTKASPVPIQISSPADVIAYCQTLAPDVQTVNLSGSLSNPNSTIMDSLMACLQTKNKTLTSIDFSSISLQEWSPFAEGVRYLSRLISLSLAGNYIGLSSSIAVLGENLHYLNALTSLDLSGNYIGYVNTVSDTIELAKGLQSLKALKFLNLADNNIECDVCDSGCYSDSSAGTVAVGNALRYLTALISLDLSGNNIGYVSSNGTVAIGQNLPYLTSLISLNLADGYIGWTDSNGTISIGQSLKHLKALTSLDLSDNEIAYNNPQGIVAIGDGLQYCDSLRWLNLAGNGIGSKNSNGTITLAKALPYMSNLQTLDLSYNAIGSTGPEGPQTLLAALVNRSYFDSEQLQWNLNGMTNVTWSAVEEAWGENQSQELMQQCQSNGSIRSIRPNNTGRVSAVLSSKNYFETVSSAGSPLATSSASIPSTFWREATRSLSTVYQALWDISEHPNYQTMAWGVAANLAYAGLQTWPLLATYAVIG
jgi:Ran GTPase-activating protein (RanGAP) involved in mRNA processing and transport